MCEVYIVLIINKRFVRWEICDKTSTLKTVFDILKYKYDINKCILEIGSMSFMNDRFCTNNLLTEIISREDIATIYVTTKRKIMYLNPET